MRATDEADSAAAERDRSLLLGGGSTPELSLLFQRHYAEIRDIARRALRHERPGHTLQATAIIHEAWLRLRQTDGLRLDDPIARRGLVATVIRRVLVDHARSRGARRHGGAWRRVPLGDVADVHGESKAVDLLDLDAAIASLAEIHPRRSRVIELRLFGGLTHAEIADCLDVSLGTVELDWKIGSHWLRTRLADT